MGGASRASQISEDPKHVLVGRLPRELPLSGLDSFAHRGTTSLHPCAGRLPVSVTSSSSDACGSGSWTACRHVSPVLVTMTTGCKAPGHQWAVALRGAMPWVREGLLSCSCGKLGRGCCCWGLSGPSLSLPWHFLSAICAGSWGRGRAPSLVGGVWEQMGGRTALPTC